MTQVEWMTSDDPRAMFVAFIGKYSRRKVLLFAVAGCAACRARSTDDRCWAAEEVVERFADGLALPDEVAIATAVANEARISAYNTPDTPGRRRMSQCVAQAACSLLGSTGLGESRGSISSALDAVEYARKGAKGSTWAQTRLLRDIVGNPFRPLTFDHSWGTTDVMLLAQGIYADRAFDRMPILADALQDAGCDNADILDHCRDTNQVHVRGCWVVDLVLGKQ